MTKIPVEIARAVPTKSPVHFAMTGVTKSPVEIASRRLTKIPVFLAAPSGEKRATTFFGTYQIRNVSTSNVQYQHCLQIMLAKISNFAYR